NRLALVEQVFGAKSSELFQCALPLVSDAARVLPCLNGLQDPSSADQREGFVKLENVWIQLPEGRREFDPEFSRIKSLAVNQNDLDTVTHLVRKGTGRGFEIHGHEAHSLDIPRVQVGSEISRVHPRSAEQFERRIRAAAHADVRTFHHGDARIK